MKTSISLILCILFFNKSYCQVKSLGEFLEISGIPADKIAELLQEKSWFKTSYKDGKSLMSFYPCEKRNFNDCEQLLTIDPDKHSIRLLMTDRELYQELKNQTEAHNLKLTDRKKNPESLVYKGPDFNLLISTECRGKKAAYFIKFIRVS